MTTIKQFVRKFWKVWALIGLGLSALLWTPPAAYAGNEGTNWAGYTVTYAAVTASSTTAGSIAPSGTTNWREVACVANDLTSTGIVFSRASETAVSTTTLATAGSRIPFWAAQGRTVTTSKGIYYSVGAGLASVALDCEIFTVAR